MSPEKGKPLSFGVVGAAAEGLGYLRNDLGGYRLARVLAQEPFTELLYDGASNVVLHREDIIEKSIVSFGPEMVPIRNFDELDGNAYPPARHSYTALKQRCDIQNASDLGGRCLLAFE